MPGQHNGPTFGRRVVVLVPLHWLGRVHYYVMSRPRHCALLRHLPRCNDLFLCQPTQLPTPTPIVESSSYRCHSSIAAMAAPEVHHLFHNPIADHSFSADRSVLAVARDTTVELYGKAGNGYKLLDELKGHDKTVTSVDIAPNSGRIVSCSQGTSRCPSWKRMPRAGF